MLHFSLLERGVCSADRRRRRFLQGKQDRKCKRISSRFNFLIMTDCILEAGAFMVACHELLCHTDSYIGKKLSAVFMQSTPKCTDSQFGQCTFMKLKNLYIFFFYLPPPPSIVNALSLTQTDWPCLLCLNTRYRKQWWDSLLFFSMKYSRDASSIRGLNAKIQTGER